MSSLKYNSKPMLLGESAPFDSPDYIFELKFDGVRVVIYLNNEKTTIISRSGKDVTSIYPEFANLYKQVSGNCILDGEIIALTDGKPDFNKLQKRILCSDKLKIDYAAKTEPAQFVAFDILHLNGKDIMNLSLLERKKILSENIKENARIVVSKFIDTNGKALFELAKKEGLEGVVAKRKSSPYRENIRSNDWIKIKVLYDEDFILLGYQLDGEDGKVGSLHFAKETENGLQDKGWHKFNLSRFDSEMIIKLYKKHNSKPVCTIAYTQKTKQGNLRTPIFKGIKC